LEDRVAHVIKSFDVVYQLSSKDRQLDQFVNDSDCKPGDRERINHGIDVDGNVASMRLVITGCHKRARFEGLGNWSQQNGKRYVPGASEPFLVDKLEPLEEIEKMLGPVLQGASGEGWQMVLHGRWWVKGRD
jgi:hypothetical protein